MSKSSKSGKSSKSSSFSKREVQYQVVKAGTTGKGRQITFEDPVPKDIEFGAFAKNTSGDVKTKGKDARSRKKSSKSDDKKPPTEYFSQNMKVNGGFLSDSSPPIVVEYGLSPDEKFGGPPSFAFLFDEDREDHMKFKAQIEEIVEIAIIDITNKLLSKPETIPTLYSNTIPSKDKKKIAAWEKLSDEEKFNKVLKIVRSKFTNPIADTEHGPTLYAKVKDTCKVYHVARDKNGTVLKNKDGSNKLIVTKAGGLTKSCVTMGMMTITIFSISHVQTSSLRIYATEVVVERIEPISDKVSSAAIQAAARIAASGDFQDTISKQEELYHSNVGDVKIGDLDTDGLEFENDGASEHTEEGEPEQGNEPEQPEDSEE